MRDFGLPAETHACLIGANARGPVPLLGRNVRLWTAAFLVLAYRRSRERLQEQSARLATLMDTEVDGIILIDDTGIVTDAHQPDHCISALELTVAFRAGLSVVAHGRQLKSPLGSYDVD